MWTTSNARSQLGASLVGQGKFAEAETLILSELRGPRKSASSPRGRRHLRESANRVVKLSKPEANPEKAAE